MQAKNKIIIIIAGVVGTLVIITTVLVWLRVPQNILRNGTVVNNQTATGGGNGQREGDITSSEFLTPAEQTRLDQVLTSILNSEGNLNQCGQMDRELVADECFSIVAQMRGQETICDNIFNQSKKDECYGIVIANRAEATRNADLCFTINLSERKLNCIFRVGLIEGNTAELCGRLSGDEATRCRQSLERDSAENEFVPPLDTDDDSLYDNLEERFGTDPNKVDTDGDGLGDYEEISRYFTDPLKSDTDQDGLNDGIEINQNTNPLSKDTDGDGLNDDIERSLGTDSTKVDTDGDGLDDSDEVGRYYTNPTNADTDGDGFNDGTEVSGGYNPNGPGRGLLPNVLL